jgi:hypothetical protein
MGKAERIKGRAWEQEVARRLSGPCRQEHVRVLVETQQGNSGDVKPKYGKPEVPVAIVKQDRQTPVVVMDLKHFLDLCYWATSDESHVVQLGYLVQCKVGKLPPVMPAYREAVEAFREQG